MSRMITNFKNDKKDDYEMALIKYQQTAKDTTLYISEDAYGNDGYRINGLCSLNCKDENEDFSKFWNVLDKFYEINIEIEKLQREIQKLKVKKGELAKW